MTSAIADPFTFVPSSPRLSVTVAEFRAAAARGGIAVDIRSQAGRNAAGVLFGAWAVDPDVALGRLTPGTRDSLASARLDSEWLIVSDDGYDAEVLVWHLHARGVTSARYVLGGHRALAGERVAGAHNRREAAAIAAH